MSKPVQECNSENGITVGLIDSIMTCAEVALRRVSAIMEHSDGLPDSVSDACDDLFQSVALRGLVAFGGNRDYIPSDYQVLLGEQLLAALTRSSKLEQDLIHQRDKTEEAVQRVATLESELAATRKDHK